MRKDDHKSSLCDEREQGTGVVVVGGWVGGWRGGVRGVIARTNPQVLSGH